MRSFLKVSVLLSLSIAAAFGTASEGWLTSYAEATKQSKKTGKPILANFTGSDWCHWCIVLHKEVFAKKEFTDWAKKNVILLELDYPSRKKLAASLTKQNDDLARKYEIRGYPTVLFLKADGTKIGRGGYMEGGPKPWIQRAEKMLSQKSKG